MVFMHSMKIPYFQSLQRQHYTQYYRYGFTTHVAVLRCRSYFVAGAVARGDDGGGDDSGHSRRVFNPSGPVSASAAVCTNAAGDRVGETVVAGYVPFGAAWGRGCQRTRRKHCPKVINLIFFFFFKFTKWQRGKKKKIITQTYVHLERSFFFFFSRIRVLIYFFPFSKTSRPVTRVFYP